MNVLLLNVREGLEEVPKNLKKVSKRRIKRSRNYMLFAPCNHISVQNIDERACDLAFILTLGIEFRSAYSQCLDKARCSDQALHDGVHIAGVLFFIAQPNKMYRLFLLILCLSLAQVCHYVAWPEFRDFFFVLKILLRLLECIRFASVVQTSFLVVIEILLNISFISSVLSASNFAGQFVKNGHA